MVADLSTGMIIYGVGVDHYMITRHVVYSGLEETKKYYQYISLGDILKITPFLSNSYIFPCYIYFFIYSVAYLCYTY